MYAKVKLHYIELQQRRLAALEMCSTAKDMVTGPTGETRLVLPSSELRDCRPSGFRSATKCVRHLRFVYVERILLPGYSWTSPFFYACARERKTVWPNSPGFWNPVGNVCVTTRLGNLHREYNYWYARGVEKWLAFATKMCGWPWTNVQPGQVIRYAHYRNK